MAASASMAFNPAGVQAQPSPSILAMIFREIYFLASCSFGIAGKRNRIKGSIFFVRLLIRPALSATSIIPVQNAITPPVAMQSDTASPALSSIASVISFIVPFKAPYTIPTRIISAQSIFSIFHSPISISFYPIPGGRQIEP